MPKIAYGQTFGLLAYGYCVVLTNHMKLLFIFMSREVREAIFFTPISLVSIFHHCNSSYNNSCCCCWLLLLQYDNDHTK